MNPYGRPQPEGFYENQNLNQAEYNPGGSGPYYPPSNPHQHRPEHLNPAEFCSPPSAPGLNSPTFPHTYLRTKHLSRSLNWISTPPSSNATKNQLLATTESPTK